MTAQTSIGVDDGRIQSSVTLAATGPFTVDFPFIDKDDIVVTLTDSAGAITSYVRGVDYTVTATANDDGLYPSGTLTWLGAGIPVAGTLTRYRTTGLSRISQLPLTGFLSRTALNVDLNRVMMAMQDFDRRLDAALSYPPEDGLLSLVLQSASQRAGMTALFDAQGRLYGGATVGSAGTSAFMLTVLDDIDAAAARTTLGAVGLTGNETVAGIKTFSSAPVVPTGTLAQGTTNAASQAYADRIGVQQVVSSITGALATGTTVMPYDDTIPQNTEGDQYMSLAITPKSATSKLVIEVTVAALASNFAGAVGVVVALFQDSTANALAAEVTLTPGQGIPVPFSFRHVMTSGTTSAITFKVRAGANSANTTTFNGAASARLMGGVMASSIVITEIGA